MAIKKSKDETMSIVALRRDRATFHLLGTTLLMNRFSEKAKQQLLAPGAKKNAAEKASTLKHDPVAEYRSSIYLNRDPKRKARIHAPGEWFKGCLANAALDTPGATKAKVERLTQVGSPQIDLFGVPRLHFGMVRNSDINRTPDVRCRACFPEWACKVEIDFISSVIKKNDLGNLMGSAGMIVGCGDWRPQKGGLYGMFRIVDADNEDYLRIVAEQGTEAQVEAINNPICYDEDSESLLAWFFEEVEDRDVEVTRLPMAAE